MRLRAWFAAALLLGLAPTVSADYAVLRNGARLHVYSYEQLGPTTRLRIDGGTVDMPAEQIVRFEPEEVFPERQAPGQDAPLTVPYSELIRAAAKKYSLDVALLASVIREESNFDPRAVSIKNAQGLMQLMPGTASRLAVRNPFDPSQNIEAGAKYLRELLDRYEGNVSLALAAYNAGPERVTRYSGVPPFRETRKYIQRVTAHAGKTGSTGQSNPIPGPVRNSSAVRPQQ